MLAMIFSFASFQKVAEAIAPPSWDVSNTYVWSVLGTYNHDITLVMNPDGTFTGAGGYPSGGTPYLLVGQTTETITAGQVTGNTITFTTTYNGPHNSGYSVTVSGTIAPDGTINGTSPWSWQMTSGSAIPIVDLSCPVNTTKTYVETVTVPANKETDTLSVNPLISGINYILKASGTADAGDNITFDAKYSFRIPTSTTWTDSVSTYETPYGPTLLDLFFNGSTPWGTYTGSHTYQYQTLGDGTQAAFKIYDVHYPNNTGNLSVDIYSCTPNVVTSTPPTNKDQCKNDGWKTFSSPEFKNQGQCVSYVQTNAKAGKK